MRVLDNELKMRLGHNQWSINSVKGTISSFLETKYTEEYKNILTKLIRHCNRKNEAEVSQQMKLECPENILTLDVFKILKKGGNIAPVMMSEINNKIYRELVDDKFGTNYHDFNL